MLALSCSNLLSVYVKIGEGDFTKPASCASWLIKKAMSLPSEKDNVSAANVNLAILRTLYSTFKILDKSC